MGVPRNRRAEFIENTVEKVRQLRELMPVPARKPD